MKRLKQVTINQVNKTEKKKLQPFNGNAGWMFMLAMLVISIVKALIT